MLVEDERDMYTVLTAILEMWGLETRVYTDLEDAIAWINSVDAGDFKGELPELALLDIRLWKREVGSLVGERLRQSPILGNIPIVLMTAYIYSPEVEAMHIEKAGADGFVQKPLPEGETLKTFFSTIIEERRQRQAGAPAPEPRILRAPKRGESTRRRNSSTRRSKLPPTS
jgi:CheY-like chemotaxis protein